jgi:hypothetical protein
MNAAATLILVGVGLAACTIPPEQPIDPLQGIAPRSLGVSSIDVQDGFAAMTAGTFIDKRHTADLVKAARRYAQTKLVPAGGPTLARATIVEAQLLAEPRPAAGGLTSAVTREPDSVLRGVLEIRLTSIGTDGLEHGSASARVERSRIVLEMTGVLERDKLAKAMTHDLLVDLDRALATSIQQNLPQLTEAHPLPLQ